MSEHNPYSEFEDAAADQGERPADDAEIERAEAGDLRWLMSSKRGRRIFARLIEKTGVFSSVTVASDRLGAIHEGRRAVGIELWMLARKHCPELIAPTLQESESL